MPRIGCRQAAPRSSQMSDGDEKLIVPTPDTNAGLRGHTVRHALVWVLIAAILLLIVIAGLSVR